MTRREGEDRNMVAEDDSGGKVRSLSSPRSHHAIIVLVSILVTRQDVTRGIGWSTNVMVQTRGRKGR